MRTCSIRIIVVLCSFTISCNNSSHWWVIHDSLKDSLSAFIYDAKAYFGEDLESPTCLVVPYRQNSDTLISFFAFPKAERFVEDDSLKLAGTYVWEDTDLVIYSRGDLDLAWLMNKEPPTDIAFDTSQHCDIHPYGRTFYVRRGILTRALPEKTEITDTELFHSFDGRKMFLNEEQHDVWLRE